MTRSYPLQTGPNCVAYSYFVAMQEALYLVDRFKRLPYTVHQVESVTGAPCVVRGSTMDRLQRAFPEFTFQVGEYLPNQIRTLPTVVSSWDLGFSHAVCLLPNAGKSRGYAYDPGQGNTLREVNVDQTASDVAVRCSHHPANFQWKKWYYRFSVVRNFVNWISPD